MINDKAVLFFDGRSRGNPGPAAGGAFLLVGGQTGEAAEFLLHATNNEAEYTGLIVGLRLARRLGVGTIEIRGDSKLVCEQVTGSWRVNNDRLAALHKEVKVLLAAFDSWQISWVRREENKEADRVCNEAMNKRKSFSRGEPGSTTS